MTPPGSHSSWPPPISTWRSPGRTGAFGSGPSGSRASPKARSFFAPSMRCSRRPKRRACSPIEPAAGSLLSRLFADPALGNPLEGDTLLWARLQDDALHVYSLAIDDRGGFALEHSTGQLTQDGMTTRYVLRLENEQIVMVEGRLERAGD